MSENNDPVMEAFGELAVALGHTATRIQWSAVKALHRLLDVHAHELAEQVRGMEDGVIRMAGRRVSDIDVVADLIDPKRQCTRCVGCGEPADNGKAHGYGAEFGGCV